MPSQTVILMVQTFAIQTEKSKQIQLIKNFVFQIVAVERFPVSEREKEQNSNSIERSRSNKGQEHNHNREVIFALPSLRLHFKSEHLQGPTTPDTSSGKRKCFASMLKEFADVLYHFHRKTVGSM